MSDTRALARTDEVAAFLDLPPRTLERWRYLGKGPRFVPLGRHVRYRWADVEKWLDTQARAAA